MTHKVFMWLENLIWSFFAVCFVLNFFGLWFMVFIGMIPIIVYTYVFGCFPLPFLYYDEYDDDELDSVMNELREKGHKFPNDDYRDVM